MSTKKMQLKSLHLYYNEYTSNNSERYITTVEFKTPNGKIETRLPHTISSAIVGLCMDVIIHEMDKAAARTREALEDALPLIENGQ